MAEHKHEWKHDSPSYDYERVICDCGIMLNWNEIIRRLNILERITTLVDDAEDNPPMRTFVKMQGADDRARPTSS